MYDPVAAQPAEEKVRAAFIKHDDALDLAADRIDFGLSRQEEADLTAHLGWCYACRENADLLTSDDAILDRFKWIDRSDPDEDYDPYALPSEDFVPTRRTREDDAELDDDGDGADGPDPAAPADSDPLRSTPGEADDDDAAGDDDDDEVDEDAPTRKDERPAPDDDEDEDEVVDYDVSPPPDETRADEDDSEDDEKSVAETLAETLDELGYEEREKDDDEPPEPSPEKMAEAEAAADAMTDEELGDAEHEATADDGDLPDCVSHGVEKAAGENGAPTGEKAQREAEEAVRDAENLTVTPYGAVVVYKSTQGFRRAGSNPTPEQSAAAAGAIRNAILRSRTGSTGVTRHQPHGRLDSRSLHRVAEGDHNLFKRSSAPDPGRFLVWVMVDVSGSMSGQTVADAAAVARALADATRGTPTVRLAVWAWSSPFLPHARAYAGVARVWETGEPTERVFRLAQLAMGGTPDAPVLDWAWRNILKQRRSDERPVILMCSDGWGYGNLGQVVAEAVKHGVSVRSVAMGEDVDEAVQEKRFGRGNYVPWRGSIDATARPLATMIGRMAAGK